MIVTSYFYLATCFLVIPTPFVRFTCCLYSRIGWMVADPLCSIMISVLIVLSVFPLMKDTIGVLLQRSPSHLDNVLPSCYRKVSPHI